MINAFSKTRGLLGSLARLAGRPTQDQATIDKSHAETDDWLSCTRFALLLGLLFLATFLGVMVGSQTFVFRDFGLFSYPAAKFQRDCFWRGEVPLWNPFNYCGVPFLAQWNTISLYPLSIIYLVLPLSWSLPMFCLVHLYCGGLGIYLLVHNWTQDRLAASLAGVIFSFNGLALSFLMWPCHAATFGWLAWVLFLGQRAWREGGKTIVWAALAGAMQMLSGVPETILFTWIILLLLACADCFERRVGSRVQVALRFGGVVLLVALLSGAQLLPFMQLLARSQRDSGYGSASWSMPLSGLANFVVPLFHTEPSAEGVYFQPHQRAFSSCYAGIGTILLGAVALRRAKGPKVWLLSLLLLSGLLLALGDAGLVYRAARAVFPAIGFARYPIKFVTVVLALAPLLAAFGLKRGEGQPPTLGKFELVCAAVLLILIGVLITLDRNAPLEGWRTTCQNGLSRGGFLILIMLLLPRVWASVGQARLLWGSALLVVFWLDFVTHMPSQNPTVPPEVYSPDWVKAGRNWKAEPKLGESRAMASAGMEFGFSQRSLTDLKNNYLLYRLMLFPNCNMLEDIPQAQGFFSLTPKEINTAVWAPMVWTDQDFSPLLDFMGVSQITASGNTLDWAQRPSAMPLVTIGQWPVFANDDSAFGAFGVTNMDFRKVVFLPEEARSHISAQGQPTALVLGSHFENQKVELRADAPTNSLVVISQTYYPAWKAYIDGQPAKLWRANYAFQAVEVPAGRHRVELRYEDRVFNAGAMLSGLGMVISGWLWVRAGRREVGQLVS